jgi:shikimate kinase
MGWTFDDVDDHALGRSGLRSVRDVLAQRGEPAWRALEAEAIRDVIDRLTARGGCAVVAVGGGAPCDARSAAELQRARANGWRIVWLHTSLPKLVERLTASEGDRPRLTNEPFDQELASLDAARRSSYESLADLSVDGDAAPAAVCAALVSVLS